MTTTMKNSALVNLCCIYSQDDERLYRRLAVHLALLQRQGIIAEWFSLEIGMEADWANTLDQRANSVQLILLLISSDFVASYSNEMQRVILNRHAAEEAVVLAILLRPVDWEGGPFGQLPVFPSNGKPITSWADEDAAFVDVIKGIRKAIAQPKKKQRKRSSPTNLRSKQVISGVVRIFCVYTQYDLKLYNELEKHLMLLQRQGIIAEWFSLEIGMEADWANTLDQRANDAQLILLLISPDFLASDYCYSNEMQQVLNRHAAGEAVVLPILLRPVDWEGGPFGQLLAFPSNGKPITSWADEDAAFVDVIKGIRKAVNPESVTLIIQEEKKQRTSNITYPHIKAYSAAPVRIFFSYAREDISFLRELEKHLASLERQKIVEISSDLQINPGENWKFAINQRLDSAQIILLLISPDFVASDYCYSTEMKRALERHRSGETIVIPIIVRPIAWTHTPFSHLQMLPLEAKPITTWIDRDDAFAEITREIYKVVQTLLARPTNKTKEQWTIEGRTFYAAEQYDKALEAYEQALLIERKDENTHALIGRIYLHMENYEAALNAYEESIRLSATASAYLFKGMVLQRLGRSVDALEAYLKAREYN